MFPAGGPINISTLVGAAVFANNGGSPISYVIPASTLAGNYIFALTNGTTVLAQSGPVSVP